MPTSPDFRNFILNQLSSLDKISSKQMMGEYMLYYRGKIIASLCDDRLMVKPLPSALAMMPAARREHTRLLPLMHELFASVSPIPLKAALAALGLCENEVRLPLVPQRATQELLTALFAALE